MNVNLKLFLRVYFFISFTFPIYPSINHASTIDISITYENNDHLNKITKTIRKKIPPMK